GRTAGRRRRDGRLAGGPRVGGRQRQRRARMRPEPDRRLNAMETCRLESPRSLRRLYAKALVGPIIPGGGNGLPEQRLELADVEIDRDHLARYDHVCGFRIGDELPATYPHVLAFPLALELMTEREFPFALLGLVHVSNRIDQRRPLRADE